MKNSVIDHFRFLSEKVLTFCGKNFDRDVKTARYLSRETKWDFFDFFRPLRTPFSTSVEQVSVGLLELHSTYPVDHFVERQCNGPFRDFKREILIFGQKRCNRDAKLQSTCPEKRIEFFSDFSLDALGNLYQFLSTCCLYCSWNCILRVYGNILNECFFFERKETVLFLALHSEQNEISNCWRKILKGLWKLHCTCPGDYFDDFFSVLIEFVFQTKLWDFLQKKLTG